MKFRAMLQKAITTFIIIMLASCSMIPAGSSDNTSGIDLLGEWEFISSEDGSADLAYDIEFLSNGTLRIKEATDVLVEEYQYEVTRPGRIELSALGIEREVRYEISENTLILSIGNGQNRYRREAVAAEPTQLNENIPLPEITPVYSGEYSFQVPEQRVTVEINNDASITLDYLFSIQNDPGALEIDIVDIALPVDTYDLGSITADINEKLVNRITKSDIISPGISLYLDDYSIPPDVTGTVHVNIPSLTNTIYPASQEETEEYASMLFSPNWYNNQNCHGRTSYLMKIILPPGLTESESRYFIPEGWPGSSEPELELMEDGRFSFTWVSDQANSYTQYYFGASFPARYLFEGENTTIPSESFMSLPSPVKALEKPNGTWEMFGDGKWEHIVEQDGILWLAGYGGLTAFDMASGQYKHYTTLDGLPSNAITSLFVTSDKILWAGFMDLGIYQYANFKWMDINSQGLDRIIGQTSDGAMWVTDNISPPYGVGRLLNGKWVICDSWDCFVEGAGELTMPTAIVDYQGTLWAQTKNQNGNPIIINFHNNNWQVYSLGLPDRFELLAVTEPDTIWIVSNDHILIYDGDSTREVASFDRNYWLAVVVSSDIGEKLTIELPQIWEHRSELYRISEQRIEKLDSTQGLPTDNFSRAYEDKSGQLWLCTPDGLMKQMPNSSWQSFSYSTKARHSTIQDIEIAGDGETWISTNNGYLNRFLNNNWFRYGENDGISSNTQELEIGKNGTVWVSSWNDGRVFSYEDNHWTSYNQANGLDIGKNIWGIEASPDGRVWAAGDGLAMYDGNDWETVFENGQDGFVDIRSVVYGLDGSIWIGGYDYRNDAKIARLIDDSWTIYDSNNGLDTGYIINSLELSPTGIVYAGTGHGLFKFVNDRWEEVGDTYSINDIAFEGDGSVWIATEIDGIIHYKNGELVEHYTHEDGLPSVRMNAIAVAPDGSIWAGGWGGVVKITP